MPRISYEEFNKDDFNEGAGVTNKRENKTKLVLMGGQIVNANYVRIADAVLDFEVRDDDVFVIGPPKCGTTWTQELVWCIANNCDLETAKKVDQSIRFPMLEVSGTLPNSLLESEKCPPQNKDSLGFISQLKGRRFIKTHLSLNLVPTQLKNCEKKAKIVYVVRDPRDACLSTYHFIKSFGYTGSMVEFIDDYLNDKVMYGPYWRLVTEYWDHRNSPNSLFLTYEEMKKDLGSVIRRTAQFLDVKLTEQQIELLQDHLSFEKMKKNPTVNHENMDTVDGRSCNFMRSGESGGYAKCLDAAQISRFDAWTAKWLRGREDVLPQYQRRVQQNVDSN